ncbi:MAG: class I SAM-dependent methyltransferase [Candidatus Omnitrophota bacterium]
MKQDFIKSFPALVSYKSYFDGFLSIDLKKMRPKDFLVILNKTYKKNTVMVSKKHGWKNVVRCPVCSSTLRNKEFSKFGFDYVCCNVCSLRYAAKIPKVTEDVYSDNSYLSETIDLQGDIDYRKKRFISERIKLVSGFVGDPSKKKLLDVGCGVGTFLEAAIKAGFSAFGQELGQELVQWTSKRLGIPIYSEPVSKLKAKGKFDVITLFDVIEHVPNPTDLIMDCKRLLKKEGIILVFTPNYDSLAVKIMKEWSTHFAPAEHILSFTRKTVEVLAKKTHLKLVYYCTRGIDMGELKSLYEWRGRKNMAAACAELYNEIQPLIDSVGAGNHMRFVLKNR